MTGTDIPARVAARRAGDPAILVASPDKAKAELGWEPRYTSLEEMITHAWRWHSAHPNGYEN